MAFNLKVDVKGLKELKRNIRKITKKLERRVLKDASLAAAEPIRKEAARLVPRSAGRPSKGKKHLADSLITKFRMKRGRFRATIGPKKDQFHGLFVEFGTSTQPARPFLRPALDSKGRQAVEIFRQVFKRGLEGVA